MQECCDEALSGPVSGHSVVEVVRNVAESEVHERSFVQVERHSVEGVLELAVQRTVDEAKIVASSDLHRGRGSHHVVGAEKVNRTIRHRLHGLEEVGALELLLVR